MATGAPGTNGVWQYGEDDSEATFSALLNKAASTTDTQIGLDRARLTALEAAGRIVQVVQVTKTDTFGTTSATFTPVTGLSVSITPKSSANKIIVLAQVSYGLGGNSTYPDTGHFKITRGGTDIYRGNAGTGQIQAVFGGTVTSEYALGSASMNYMDSPGTTSPVTYQVEIRRGRSGMTTYVNRVWNDLATEFVTRGASSIILLEVKG